MAEFHEDLAGWMTTHVLAVCALLMVAGVRAAASVRTAEEKGEEAAEIHEYKKD